MTLRLTGKSALLISECQRGIVAPGGGGFAGLIDEVASRGILPRIAALAAAFRAADRPVFHLTIAHRPDFADLAANSLLAVLARKNGTVVAGTPAARIVPELAPHPQDFIAERSSGLIGLLATTLDGMLRRMGIETLVLTGVSTNVAIAGCAIAAADFGYHAVVAEDCIAASDPQVHDVIVASQLRMVARVSTAAEIAVALGSGL